MAGIRRRRQANAYILAIALFLVAVSDASAQNLFIPGKISPGDPLACWLESEEPLGDAVITLFDSSGKKLGSTQAFFMPSGETAFLYGFLLAVPIKAPIGSARLLLEIPADSANKSDQRVTIDRKVEIEPRAFLREDIPLDKANTELRVTPDPAKTAESLAFAKIFAARDITALFAKSAMVRPLDTSWRETASFGDERRYLYFGGGSDSTIHGGIDLGAKEGSAVLACAAGRVVFAGMRIVTGNTVVIEHLPGLFSVYMHLSALEKPEGAVVDSGERIGRVGSTGLSTGPHLHWEIRVGGISVNPYYWLSRPLLDKGPVSGTINTLTEGR